MKTRSKIAAVGVAAIATSAAVAGPCTPPALSAADCDAVRAEFAQWSSVDEAAQQAGTLSDAEVSHLNATIRVLLKAVDECEQGTTTTTSAPSTTGTTDGSSTSTTVPPSTTTTLPATPPGLPVDESAIPAPIPGSTTVDTRGGVPLPGPAGDGVAAFRISCTPARMNFDDAIIYPGQARRSHLHTYFGNDSVDATSTPESVANDGGSTCFGGTVNRSAYWVPSLIDTGTNAPVASFDDIGQHTGWAHRGAWSTNGIGATEAVQVYYKSGYRGVPASAITQWLPPGLRMIAGDSMRTAPMGTGPFGGVSPIRWACIHPSNTGAVFGDQHIPACAPGNLLIQVVEFPQCWDGRNLDSADHRSHMAYGQGDGRGCPSSHPVALPQLEMHVRNFIQPGVDTARLRLSSDTYDGPAGYSSHGDFVNGWNPADGQAIIDTCYRPVARDCGVNRIPPRELV